MSDKDKQAPTLEELAEEQIEEAEVVETPIVFTPNVVAFISSTNNIFQYSNVRASVPNTTTGDGVILSMNDTENVVFLNGEDTREFIAGYKQYLSIVEKDWKTEWAKNYPVKEKAPIDPMKPVLVEDVIAHLSSFDVKSECVIDHDKNGWNTIGNIVLEKVSGLPVVSINIQH